MRVGPSLWEATGRDTHADGRGHPCSVNWSTPLIDGSRNAGRHFSTRTEWRSRSCCFSSGRRFVRYVLATSAPEVCVAKSRESLLLCEETLARRDKQKLSLKAWKGRITFLLYVAFILRAFKFSFTLSFGAMITNHFHAIRLCSSWFRRWCSFDCRNKRCVQVFQI